MAETDRLQYLKESELVFREAVSLDAERLLRRYAGLLATDGTRLGLTHLTSEQIFEQICRSLALSEHLTALMRGSKERGQTVIDVGSGSGLPAVPVAVFLADRLGELAPPVVMIEPRRKAVGFLEKVVRELDLASSVVHDRAEDAVQGNWSARGNFVTAKALASPDRAIELCAPLCKIGGVIVLTGRTQSLGPVEALTPADLNRLGLGQPQSRIVFGPGGLSQAIHTIPKTSEPHNPPHISAGRAE